MLDIAVAQQTISINDDSSRGTPLTISGSVTVTEATENGATTVSYTRDISGRNISGKTILALVATLDLETASTPIWNNVIQIECFFAPDVFEDGQVHALFHGSTGSAVLPAASASSAPRATFRVIYAQFLDGSTFGTPKDGKEILSLRRLTWKTLKDLNKTYEKAGQSEFLHAIQSEFQPSALEGVIQNVRSAQDRLGGDAGINMVRDMLSFANQYRRLLSLDEDLN